MRKDKQKAIEMRIAGNSYNAISSRLKISKGTLSAWFAGADWSKKVRSRISVQATKASATRMQNLNRVRGVNLKQAYSAAREEAHIEFAAMKYHPLFIAGIMLYWGEGDKATKHQVRLVNADPLMLRLYLAFLRDICQIPREKIRAAITAYPDLDEELCRQFWSGRTGLSPSSFTKTIVITGRQKTKHLSFGMCTIIVSSAYFKVKMLEWIKLASGELMNRAYYENI